jgi:hypothetical protein
LPALQMPLGGDALLPSQMSLVADASEQIAKNTTNAFQKMDRALGRAGFLFGLVAGRITLPSIPRVVRRAELFWHVALVSHRR